jgi:hypothetical protein
MEISDNGEMLSEHVHTRDYVDVLNEFDEARFNRPRHFWPSFFEPRRLLHAPPGAHPEEVTVWCGCQKHGRGKTGRAAATSAITPNPSARRPHLRAGVAHFARPRRARDIIMVGPHGHRAVPRVPEQRTLDGACGCNWLFFGDSTAPGLSLRGEFAAFEKTGILHRLDPAFSTIKRKIYVQHRMKEQARELWPGYRPRPTSTSAAMPIAWPGRPSGLIQIAQEQGMTPEAAADYVNVTLLKRRSVICGMCIEPAGGLAPESHYEIELSHGRYPRLSP